MELLPKGERYFAACACKEFYKSLKRKSPAGFMTCRRTAVSSFQRAEWLLSHEKPEWLVEDGIFFAAKEGDICVIELLRSHGCKWKHGMISNAAERGHWKMVEWMIDNECPWHKDWLSHYAAEQGRIDILKLLKKIGCVFDEVTLECASRCGHLDVLEYLREQECPYNKTVSRIAAFRGHLHILEYLQENGYRLSRDAARSASDHGHWGVVDWLLRHGLESDAYLSYNAAAQGRADLLEWLHSINCEFDTYTFTNAARAGNLAVLDWLHAQNCPCVDADVFESAARFGNLNVIEWLFEKGYIGDGEACISAAQNGHLDVLKYLYSRGVRGTSLCMHETFRWAACRLNTDMVTYLEGQGCERDAVVCSISAATHSNLAMLEWLNSRGLFCWDKEMLHIKNKEKRRVVLKFGKDLCIHISAYIGSVSEQ